MSRPPPVHRCHPDVVGTAHAGSQSGHHKGANVWPDKKSKPPARRKVKVKGGQIGLKTQPKKPRKVKRKEKSGREGTGGGKE